MNVVNHFQVIDGLKDLFIHSAVESATGSGKEKKDIKMEVKYLTNMKLNDLAEYEKKNAKVDKKGNILCPECEKEPAPDNEYGIIKRCPICEKKERYYNVMVSIDEPSGRKSY